MAGFKLKMSVKISDKTYTKMLNDPIYGTIDPTTSNLLADCLI